MLMTLRKAAALQLAITETLKGLKLDGSVPVSVYDPEPNARIDVTLGEFAVLLQRRAGLLDALYTLRTRVGVSNSASGVNWLLAELARVERDVQLYTTLSRCEPRDTPEILLARTQRLRTREEAPTGRFGASQPLPETLQAHIFDQSAIDGFSTELRRLTRRRQQLKDELLELNAKTTIEIGPETADTLRREELI